MSLTTPVVLMIFNRPELTRQVFAAIRQARPRQLLVVADGPRASRPTDDEHCWQTRQAVASIDWDCEVQRNYSEGNLGCGRRISSGLDWVFSQVQEAIILEDDCLPDPSFFGFCQELLQRYRTDERVMHIGGDNFQRGNRRSSASYYFSKYSHVWGWATWRRAWAHYDFAMKSWPQFRDSGMMRGVFAHSLEREFWTAFMNEAHQGLIDTWDYQWLYACWTQGGLAVVPESNLVSNIGFGPESTHTNAASGPAMMPVEHMGDIAHPSFVVVNDKADRFSYAQVFRGPTTVQQKLFRKIKSRLRRLVLPRTIHG